MRKINFSLGVGNRNTGTKKNLFAMLNLHRNMTNRLILEQVYFSPCLIPFIMSDDSCQWLAVPPQKKNEGGQGAAGNSVGGLQLAVVNLLLDVGLFLQQGEHGLYLGLDEGRILFFKS